MSRQYDMTERDRLQDSLREQERTAHKMRKALTEEEAELFDHYIEVSFRALRAERFIREHGMWGMYQEWQERTE